MRKSNFTKLRLPCSVISVDTPKRGQFLQDGVPNPSKEDILGRGSYGTVLKAIYKGKQVAVKMIENINESKQTSVQNESNILGWKHENIIQILKIDSGPRHAIVIMERYPGYCLQHIIDQMEIPLYHILRISKDLANALEYCHDRSLLHLDVKPQNILIATFDSDDKGSSDYSCKLCDFGSSVMMKDTENKTITTRGTVRYMAPELLKNEQVSTYSDIFSIGITMWQLKTRIVPYSLFDDNDTVAYKVVKENLRPDSTSLNTTKLIQSPNCQNNCICRHFSTNKSIESISDINQFIKSKKFNRTASPLRNRTPNKRVPFLNLNKQLNSLAVDSMQKSPRIMDRIQCSNNTYRTNQSVVIKINSEDFEENFNLQKIFAPKRTKDENLVRVEYEKLYKNCWAHDPTKRPSASCVKSILNNILKQF